MAMTSIEKDLRELIVEWRRSSTTWIAPETVESLIPRIVAAVEQAQADALESLARSVEANRGSFTVQWIAANCKSFTPRRVQIEAELRIKLAEHGEAMGWMANLGHETSFFIGHVSDCWSCARIKSLVQEIATLERELEAERKGVGQ